MSRFVEPVCRCIGPFLARVSLCSTTAHESDSRARPRRANIRPLRRGRVILPYGRVRRSPTCWAPTRRKRPLNDEMESTDAERESWRMEDVLARSQVPGPELLSHVTAGTRAAVGCAEENRACRDDAPGHVPLEEEGRLIEHAQQYPTHRWPKSRLPSHGSDESRRRALRAGDGNRGDAGGGAASLRAGLGDPEQRLRGGRRGALSGTTSIDGRRDAALERARRAARRVGSGWSQR